jgi:multidrug efflux pump
VNYPGASAQTVQDTVIQVIEQALNGIDNLTYITSSELGRLRDDHADVRAGHRARHAQVQVQTSCRRHAAAAAGGPASGIRVNKPARNFLVVMGFISADGSMSNEDPADYVATNILDPLNRTPGVGDVTMFASQYAMRIWLDPRNSTTTASPRATWSPPSARRTCRCRWAHRWLAGHAGAGDQREHHRSHAPLHALNSSATSCCA